MSSDIETDRLVTRAAAGDETARDQLFWRYRGRLKQMIRVRVDPRLARRLDTSDIVQEVMLEAAKRLDNYAGSRKIPFYPWLRQLAWDRLVELHRWHFRQKRSVQREDTLPCHPDADSIALLADRLAAKGRSPSASVIRRELVERVQRAMEQLDPEDREILTLRHLEQLSTRETATVADISLAAAKSRHFRAMQRLLRELDWDGESHE